MKEEYRRTQQHIVCLKVIAQMNGEEAFLFKRNTLFYQATNQHLLKLFVRPNDAKYYKSLEWGHSVKYPRPSLKA
jgi:hypothetical protein